jgi:preprotein translocase subunit YajC
MLRVKEKIMFWNLLTSSSSTPEVGTPWGSYLMIGILFAVIIVFMVLNRRTQKKRQEETTNMLNAIRPGTKVKTIGGICGVVAEVCNEDNTFVLETGSEKTGKSYIRFDKQAIYQTDAVAENQAPVSEVNEEKAEENATQEEVFEEENTATEAVNETVEESVEETAETETTDEE